MTVAVTVEVPAPHRVPGTARRDAEILTRLHKARGQLAGVEKMHAGGRYCIDVLDQLAAVRAAIDAIGLLVLEDHLKACVRDAVEHDAADEKVDELVLAVRRFVRSR